VKGRREIDRRSFLSRSAVTGGAVALGAMAPAALAGCSSGSSGSPTTSSGSKPGVGSGNPVRGGALTVAVLADIDGFYPPTNHWDTNGFNYANAIYDPLMAVAADGSIQITYGAPVQLATFVINLTPQIKVGGAYTLLSGVGANTGNIDWSCVSVGNSTSAAQGMVAGAYGAGTVLAKYAPTQCK